MSSAEQMFIFAGPSLFSVGQATWPGIELLPPARNGDLYALAERAPNSRVLIIDGDFNENYPLSAIEVFDTLSLFSYVAGSTSMGALRATELQRFGMIGLGGIFAKYVSGEWIGDDEVSLIYDPDSKRPLTVPLCDIRSFAEQLCFGQEILKPKAESLIKQARSIHFAQRTPSRVQELLRDVFEISSDGARSAFIALTVVDFKTRDALDAIALFSVGARLVAPDRAFDWEEFCERAR